MKNFIAIVFAAMFVIPVAAQAKETCWSSEAELTKFMQTDYNERLIGSGKSTKDFDVLVYAADDGSGSFTVAYQHAAEVSCIEFHGFKFKRPDTNLPDYVEVAENGKVYDPHYIGVYENGHVFMLYIYDDGTFDIKMLVADGSGYVGDVIEGGAWTQKSQLRGI